jgi:D-alanine-D-alanine ligase
MASNDRKLRVAVIFGGRSTEHEVSLQSARNIVDALDPARFEPVLIGIDKQGAWHLSDASSYLLHADDPALIALNRSNLEIAMTPGKSHHQWIEASSAHVIPHIDVVFPIVHGTQGEDGSLQGMLTMAGLPYVGSGVLGSAVCMDKDVAKRLLRDAGLPVAPYICLTRNGAKKTAYADVVAQLGLPLFVKPANLGSSVGVSKVGNEAEYEIAVAAALTFDHKVLVESAIVGREIECAVLGNDAPEASDCGEIVVSKGFYSYESKYIDEDAAQVVVPAVIDVEASERIRAMAIAAFQTLECAGLARVDVFLQADGEVIINEINTLPGFTKISMYPKLWQGMGMRYQDLVSKLIDLALERYALDTSLKRAI